MGTKSKASANACAELPLELEPWRILTMDEVVALTSLNPSTIRRDHADKLVRLSARRLGMTRGNALAIVNGTTTAEAAE